ncbi:MAG: 50S ribosomal protein L1 [Methanomicrobia archaeon]|nr:50S ribosomal protein L1 [Methanomicrobia archaeon]RLF93550.1 MAG: 50S ribosomal protein L1 [Thermococci archaeon]RLF94528.1 MAG: 50S ribosomal protein L1 [Thermococci archaeon]RLG01096.1 MAG: 50S ribosomal protein L1 [Thermococci archaeon]HDN81223.1 50S ribosomal protein L1 [Methanomicrobia archaeon]
MLDALKKAVKEAKKKGKPRNFTQSIDIVINLKDVSFKDPKNKMRQELVLPHGKGKDVKIGVFAEGDMAIRGKKLGLQIFSKKELESISKDKRKARKMANAYDFFIAQADMMPLIGKVLGPVLGRRNKMPVIVPPTAPLDPIVEKLKNSIRINTRDTPIVQAIIGNEKMDDDKIVENGMAVLNAVKRKYEGMNVLRSVYVKTTMGPTIKVI